MPIPAIPLAGGLASLFGGAFAWFVAHLSFSVTRKTAIALALVTFTVGGWVAIQAAVYGAWLALAWSVPADLSIPMGFLASLMPSNFAACIEAVVLAKIGRWLWDGQQDLARAVAMV